MSDPIVTPTTPQQQPVQSAHPQRPAQPTCSIRYKIARTDDRVSIELGQGEDFAIFTAPAEDFFNFHKDFSDALAAAFSWKVQQRQTITQEKKE